MKQDNYPNTQTTKFNRWMLMAGIAMLSLFATGVNAQIAVTVDNPTNTTPNLAASYTDLATALTAVNAVTAMSGPVTLTLSGSETAPVKGFVLGSSTLNPVLSSTNTLRLVGPATINAGVGTASSPNNATPDGMFVLNGTDYVTLDSLTFTDGNSASATVSMEFGVGLFKRNASDGAQNNTISNCTFNMQRVNNASGSAATMQEGSIAIRTVNSVYTAAITALTITTAGGTNSYNKFYANTINGGNAGISLNGPTATSPFTTGDTGNDVGGTSAATGNFIYNFGGGATTNAAVGIRANNQWGVNISYNTINNNDGGGVNHATTLRGIYAQAGTSANATINNNTITLHCAATSSSVWGIDNNIGSTAASNTVDINNNTIQNSTYSTATTATWTAIQNQATAATVNMNGNTVTNNTVGNSATTSSATLYGIYSSASATNLSQSNNTITNNTIANQAGTIYCMRSTTSLCTINGNTISGNSIPNNNGSSSAILHSIYNLASPTQETVNNNTIFNQTISGSGTSTSSLIAGIYMNTTSSSVKNWSGNTIYNLTYNNSSTGSAAVHGLYTASGATISLYKNKIYDLTSNGAGSSVNGINIVSGSTVNCYNNLVGNLSTPSANAADPLAGIRVGGGAAVNLHYNTVYLNASSTGALFGSSGLSISTTPTVTLRNNLVVNTSTVSGAAYTVAHRRSSNSLGSYSTSSNNNLFYSGTPSSTNLIYIEGTSTYTNDKQTINDYKSFMGTRDQNSVTENPSFASTTGSSSSFLHFAASTNTVAESGGASVSGVTDDYDGDTRQGETGYAGAGSAPDIGADEFEGNNPAPVISGVSITPNGNQCTASSRAVSATVTTPSGTLTSVVINYALNGTPQTPITMTNTSGNIWDGTIPVPSPGNATVTWSIAATNTVPFTTTYSGTSYKDAPWTGVTSGATATPTTVCAGDSTLLAGNFTNAGLVNLGAGGSTSSSNPTSPFNGGYGGQKTQFLYTAAELYAAGLGAGAITSIAFDITVAGSTYQGFAISMGHTSLTEFVTPVNIQGGLTDVYTPADFTPATGVNTFTLTTPFVWNGTSNLLVSFCWSNNNASNTSSTVRSDATSNYSSQSYRKDNETSANLCAFTGATGAGTFSFTRLQARAQLIVNGNKIPQSTYSWSDGVSTVGSTYELYQTPSASTIYTVVATTVDGSCTASATVSVTRDDLTITGTTGQDLSCYQSADGEITVTATSTAGGHMFSLNGGTPQASGTFTGLAAGSYTIVVTNANNCSQTTVTSLTEPAQVVTVASSNSPVCDGATLNLDATGAYSNYAWTGPDSYSASGATAAQSLTASLLSAGDYTVTATDVNGCTGTSTTTVVVTGNVAVDVSISASPSLTVCTGDSVAFTATPTNGGTNPTYEFFVNNVSVQGPGASDTYGYFPADGDQVYVVLNSDITCTTNDPANSDTLTVNVSGAVAAAVSLAPSDNSYCGSQSITFTATPTAGGLTPSYEFFVNGVSVQNGSSDTYSYTPADEDTVYVIMTSSFACATGSPATSSDVIMVVYDIPADPTITPGGATTFCAPGSVTLTSSYVGGNVWSTTETTDAITVSTSGSYTVTYTDGNGCSATSAATVVTVNTATASIAGDDTLCTGETNVLTASASPAAVSYLWSPGGQTTDTIQVSAGGTYTVVTTDANGCTDSESITVSEFAIPTASISGAGTFCTGVPELLTASATAGSGTIDSYQWVLNGSTNVGTNSSTYSASAAGSYTVVVTNSNGCSFTSAAHVLAGNGPLNGTYTIDATQPASCTNFQSFADAFAELNLNGVGGHVLFNVAAGQSDTANLTLDMCSLGANAPNASQTLTFRKSGVGANPLITAGTGSGSTDAIVKIVGVDYLTFDAIDLQENANNTTDAMMAEAGYALLKCSGTDGAQNDTIQNCVVTLNKANIATVGIYAPNLDANFAAVTVTAASGAHSNNKYFSNTVSNSYFGIVIGGMNDVTPYALYDHNNEIGAVGKGNNVSNLGGGSATTYGIFADYQDDFNMNGNTINTGANGGTGLINALRLGDMKNSNANVDGNTVTLQTSASATAQCIAFRSSAGSRVGRPESSTVTNTVNITNNTIQNCTYTGSNDLWLMFLGRAAGDTLAAYNLNVSGNQLINNTSSSTNATGTMYGIIAQATGDSVAITNNNISNNTMNGATGHGMRMIVTGFNSITNSLPYSPKFNVSGNTLLNNASSATTGTVSGISVETYTGATPLAGTVVNVDNNKVGAVTLSQTTGAYTGIGVTTWASSVLSLSGNKVYDIVRNAATTGSFTGIAATAGATPLSYTIENDTIYNVSMTGATSATFTALNSTSAPTQPSSISNNVVATNTVNGTGTFTGIANTTGVDNLTMNGNLVNDNYKSGTGTMSLMSHGTPDTLVMNNNTVTNNRMLGGAAASTLNCVIGSTSKYTFDSNLIENNYVTTMSGSSIATVSGYTNTGSPTEETLTNNIIRRLYVNGTSTGLHQIRAFNHNTTNSGLFRTVSDNVIDSLYTNLTSSANIVGMISSLGNNVTISKNKIFDLYPGQSGSSASAAKGISVTSGTTTTISNNLIGIDVSASTPVLVGNNALVGVEVTGGTATNIYYNTIRIAGGGSGTAFGSSGISITSTTPIVSINNNIVLNLATPGGAAAVNSSIGLRRTATAFTGYDASSNKNIWYSGTPTSSRLLYFDGTNSYQTLAAFKAAVTPRENGSQTENVTLLSTVGANANYLHVDASVATTAESGAASISGITDDYDGDIRQGETGYAGTGTSPDIGADEFNGIAAAPQIANVILSPGDTCVAVSHQISVDVTSAIGTVDSVRLSYSFDAVPQTPITMTVPTSGNTYVFTIPAATPTNAVVTWSLNGWNSALLSASYTGTSYQDDYLNGIVVTASSDPAGPICDGDTITLTASIPGLKTVGAGALTTTSYQSPFYHLYGGLKDQFLITAADLNAAGITAGNITSLAFDVVAAGTTYNTFGIHMGTTALGALSTSLVTGLTSVYSSASETPAVGINTYTFTTPFYWNGTSNLVIQTCWSNNNTGGTSSTVRYDATSYVSNAYYRADSQTESVICGTTSGTGTNSGRPKMIFGVNGIAAYTTSWSDGTSNIGSGATLTIVPTATAAYTVTATDGLGCTLSAITDTVEVLPIPAAPAGFDDTQCGNGAPTCYVQGTPGATFNWYDAAVGGTLLQSSTDTTYTTSINTTTSFWVAEVGTNGCPGDRVMVTQTVTQPDPIDAQVNFSAVCPGTTVDLTAVQTGSTNTYDFVWTADPSSNSGISGSLIGNPVSATPTAPGTYTYIVTATDIPNQCVIQDSVDVLVYNVPAITSITAEPDTICAGDSTVLTALTPDVVPGQAQVGTGTSATSTYPYYRLYGSSKTQMLYLASELTAAGLQPGDITALGFDVSTASSVMPNVRISLKNTSSSVLTASTFETGLTQVASIDTVTPVLGVNLHPITAFNWDGTSNLLVEYCFENGDAGASSSSVRYSNPGFSAVVKQYQDNAPSHCSSPAGTFSNSSTIRPNLYLSGQVNGFGAGNYGWTWEPGSVTGNEIVAYPSITTNYTVTAYDSTTTCTNSATVNVLVNPTPPAPTAFNGAHCGLQTPNCYVTRSQAGTTFNWYTQPTGGTAIAGQNDSILVAYPRDQQDTFYVAEVYATGPCEGPRSMVIEVHTAADAITATATVPNDTICPFGTVTLSATQGSMITYTTYTWTTIPAGGNASGQNTTATVPNNAGQLIWVVSATDGTCNTVAYDTITVVAPPVLANVMSDIDSVCPGTTVTLSAQTADITAGLVNIGTQTTTIGGTNGNPYRSGNGTGNEIKTELLVLASELSAAGLYAGPITSLGFTCTGIGGTVINFEIKMAHTSATALTSTFETASYTSVYTLASLTTVLGLNTHTFSTPFIWDGVSNILIQTCQENSITGTNTVAASTPAFTANNHAAGSSTACSALTGTTVTGRPIMQLGGQTVGYGPGSVNWEWNPGSIANDTAVVNPTSTTTYVVTATDPVSGCFNQDSVTVFVHPTPAAPINPVDLTQCGSAVPLISVTRGGDPSDTFKWYYVSTGGTEIAGETDSVLTSLIVSSTTTFYVAAFNGYCESSRTAVTVTVNQPDSVSIDASLTSGCLPLGGPITLDAIQYGMTSNYVYTWDVNPSANSGQIGSSGTSISIEPTATGNYTITLTAVDAGASCTRIVELVVDINVAPVIGAVTANPDTICAGENVTLTAASYGVTAGTAQIGTATTTTSTYPYYRLFGSSKTQMLYRASELTAAGLTAGNITSIGFYVTTASTAMPNVVISMKNTSISVMTASTFETGLTQVATNSLFTPVANSVNTHPITPFYWDGTSNLLVEFCFENNDAGGSSTTVRYSNPGFSAVVKRYMDNNATYCSNPSSGTYSNSSTIRPNLYIGGQLIGNTSDNFTWTWNPGSLNGDTVTVNPTTTTTYTVTAAAGVCTDDTTVTVVVNPLPATPIAHNSTQCGYGTPTAWVEGSGGTFTWFADASSQQILSNTITVNLSNPGTDEGNGLSGTSGYVCPGNNQIGFFTLPPINGTVLGARMTITGVALNGGSYGEEAELSFSGPGITGTSPCFSGSTGADTPNPFDWETGFGAAGLSDTAALAALLNTAGGTINIFYADAYNDVTTGPDATFPATATLQYYYLTNTFGTTLLTGQTDSVLSNYPINETTTFYVIEYDGTCYSDTAIVTATVTPVDTATATVSNDTICLGASVDLIAVQTGSEGNTFTYTWTPSPEAGSGITGTASGSPVTITPTAAGTYVYTLNAVDGACNATPTTVTLLVVPNPSISLGPDITICSGSSVDLTAQSPEFIPTLRWTELMVQGWITSGYSGFTPAYITVPTGTTEDIWEVTNLGSGPSDPSGVTFEHWSSSSTTAPTNQKTVPSGAPLIPSGGSLFLMANTANPADDIANNVYRFSASTVNIGSGTAGGYIIRKDGVIIDAVAVNGYTFPAASGVTPADWSGAIPSNSGQNGSVLIANDNNTNTSWAVTSSAGYKSSYGTLNPGVTATLPPVGAVTWTSDPAGFSGNTPTVNTGPVTSNTNFIATISNDFGCSNADTIAVLVASSPGVATITSSVDTICHSGTVTLTASGLAVGATIQWQSSPSGLVDTWTNIGTDTTVYVSGTISSTTYFRLYATCSGTDTSGVKEIVVVAPAVTSTMGATRCGVGQVTMTASGTGTLNWYTASSGGTLLFTGSPFVDTVFATTTYYVEAAIGSCINTGGRTVVSAILNPAPVATFTANTTSVCDGETLTLTASSANAGYTYYWSHDGVNIVFIGNPYVIVPDSTDTYYMLAADSSGGVNDLCATYDGPLTVTWNEQPITPVVSPSMSTVCTAGDSVQLTVSNAPAVSSGFAVVGNGTVQNTTTSTTQMPPYGAYYTGNRHQMLVLAADMQAQGIAPGPITSLAFDVVSDASTLDYNGFTMKIGHTTATSLTSTFEPAPSLTVFTSALFNPTVGWSTHTFSTPFVWDGTSNVLVETYFSNCVGSATCSGVTCSGTGSGVTYDENAVVNQTTTSYVSHSFFYSDGSGCSPETQTSATTTTSTLPNMRFGAQVGDATLYTWNPGGATGSSVYVTPTANTIYTVTATLGPCSATGTAQVDYTPVNLVITPSGSTTFCGSGSVDLDAGAGYASYSWSDGVSVIGTTQIITVSPTTTTIYTATVDSGACTVSETITVTVYPDAPITITPSSMAPICGGAGSIDLTADAGYTNYLWSPGGETTQMITVSPVATTTYTVTADDGNGCSQEGTYTVTSYPAPSTPVITPSVAVNPFCWDGVDMGAFVTLTADTTGAGAGASIEWNDLFASTDDFIDVYAADYGMGQVTFILTVTNSFGCQSTGSILVDIDTCATAIDLDLTLFLEGYYLGGGTMWSTLYDLDQGFVFPSSPIGYPSTATDSIEVNLWDPANLSNPGPDYSEKVILHNDGSATASFATAPAGSYWVAVKHRNHIETWSSSVQSLVSGSNSYNFSTSLTQAYDDGFNPPMASMDAGTVFAFYGGDVNQDGTVDATDMADVDNDNNIFAFGYNVTDCTGDGATDASDIAIVDNNQNLFLFYARPY